MAEVGRIAMVTALVVVFYAIAAFVIGIRSRNARLIESGKGAVLGLFLLLTVAIFILVYFLMTGNFSIQYVANYTDRELPLLYKFSALWAGNEGSLLLWVWVLALMAGILAFTRRQEDTQMIPYVLAILMGIASFFVYVLVFVADPFVTLPQPLPDGYGLNPLLQNPGMLIHPTTQYIGYVGFSVPYAYAMTALILKKAGDTWIKVTRRWTLFAWLFLSIGMIYGAQWAYVELGWGGYWAWDPVENASLLPWLTGTAFFHSVMIQERKGMLKVWNVMLIIITFILTIFGTFLVRSGVLKSVHAFSDGTLGLYFTIFMGTSLAASLWLAFDRMPTLREENQFESLLSKESSFLLNNLLLVGSAFAVFWGTVFPLVSEAVTGTKVSVGPPFYNQVNVPIGLVMVLLIGICPLIAWRKSSLENIRHNFMYPFAVAIAFAAVAYLLGIRQWLGLVPYSICVFVTATILLEVYRAVRVRMKMTGEGPVLSLGRLLARNRRRYGGYMVHLAVIIMIVGMTGIGVFKLEVEKSVKQGETIQIGSYELLYQGIQARKQGSKEVVYADLRVTRIDRSGERREIGILRPEKVFHPKSEQPTTEVGILGGWKEDLFVILNGWDLEQGVTSFKVLVNPLVAWIWLGEYVLIAGTLFAMWPSRRYPARQVQGS